MSQKLLIFIIRLRQELKRNHFRREMIKAQLIGLLIDLATNSRPNGREGCKMVNLGFTCTADRNGADEIGAAILVLEREKLLECGVKVSLTKEALKTYRRLGHSPCRQAVEDVVKIAIERIAEAIKIAKERYRARGNGAAKQEEGEEKPSIRKMRLFIPRHRRKGGEKKPRDMVE